jgi:hypothetical protein
MKIRIIRCLSSTTKNNYNNLILNLNKQKKKVILTFNKIGVKELYPEL